MFAKLLSIRVQRRPSRLFNPLPLGFGCDDPIYLLLEEYTNPIDIHGCCSYNKHIFAYRVQQHKISLLAKRAGVYCSMNLGGERKVACAARRGQYGKGWNRKGQVDC